MSKTIIGILAFVLSCATGFSLNANDTEREHIKKRYTIFFPVGVSDIHKEYKENSHTIQTMIDDIKTTMEIEKSLPGTFTIVASTSPEGPLELNQRLAMDRAYNTREILLQNFPQLMPQQIKLVRQANDWSGMVFTIRRDTTFQYRDQLLEILTDPNIKNLDAHIRTSHPQIYDAIKDRMFENMRTASVTIEVIKTKTNLDEYIAEPAKPAELTGKTEESITESTTPADTTAAPVITPAPAPAPAPAPVPVMVTQPEIVKDKVSESRWTLKTNLIGWSFAMANLAVEFDIVKHLSIAVPVYYSGGFDIVKDRVKFRGLILQPELRYYPWLNKRGNNGGFFLGAHFGLGWYNFAIGGDYRIQDHQGKHPSLGGGLSIGGNFQFKRNPNWGMEFAVGGGVYDSTYDLFYNEANGPYYKKGIRELWYGVDNASISFTYTFNAKQRGGKK